MDELLSKLEWINDPRQSWKTKHKMMDIIMIVLLSMLGNCDDWDEIQAFAVYNEEVLRDYLELTNGIPSKDTIRRVMGMVEPEALQMGTQTEIAKQITKQKGDYVLVVKGDQPTLHQDIIDYFADDSLLAGVKESGNYKCTVEKARGQIEKREYYQTQDIQWMAGKADWSKLTSIGMVEKTIDKDGKITVERRYFISSLNSDIELFARAVRGHWAIESMHWHLDVTFRENFNATLDRQTALNLNIIRKLCLSILRLLDIGRPRASLKLKRKAISWNPMKFLAEALAL